MSMTKMVATVAALQLVETGRLDLDAPIDTYCPEFADVQVLDGFDGDTPRLRAPASRATVKQLVTHTTGLGYWFFDENLAKWEAATSTPNVLSGTNVVFTAPLLADPGTTYVYGINTDWLGKVVEAAGGVALDVAIKVNFFASPILGALSDKFGRRPVLLLGFSGLALSFIVTGLATALWMLIVVRVFSGAMQANAAVANAYVADITRRKTGPALWPDRRDVRPGLHPRTRDGRLSRQHQFALAVLHRRQHGRPELDLRVFRAAGIAGTRSNAALRVAPSEPVRRADGPEPVARGGFLLAVIGLAGLAQFTLHNSFVLYTTFKFGWGPRDNELYWRCSPRADVGACSGLPAQASVAEVFSPGPWPWAA